LPVLCFEAAWSVRHFWNVCHNDCRFCAFAQRRTDAYTLSLDQIGERAEEAWAAGATEVCMQGGIHPSCRARRTSTSRPRSSGAPPACTCTRSTWPGWPSWRHRNIVGPLGRPLHQRTTLYGTPAADRVAAAEASDGVCTSVRQGLPILAR